MCMTYVILHDYQENSVVDWSLTELLAQARLLYRAIMKDWSAIPSAFPDILTFRLIPDIPHQWEPGSCLYLSSGVLQYQIINSDYMKQYNG